MILQILRRKYNKNYLQTIGNFKTKQQDEIRNPSPFPKVFSKVNNPLRKIEPPSERINL